ncbi:MAG: glycoside hydrolase family 127 protein [Eubacteriales bacterium]|nr:glycoside hydrolase family 127 protein [Eubacteriales bacterium]
MSMQIDDYITLVRQDMLPFQWEALNDRVAEAEPSYSIANFRNAACKTGDYCGTIWQDSDMAKWLEAVGHSLACVWDEDLYRKAEQAVELIVAAQDEDGYINTYFTLKEPGERWHNVEQCHELYCAGHLIEAAVAYFLGTGRRKLLAALCRYADYIDSVFGPEEGKLHGYPGHEEIELALCKLYRVTGEKRYLKLAEYFIDIRGTEPNFFLEQRKARGFTTRWPDDFMPLSYFQAHKPVREQAEAVGHAVRAVYLYAGMADVAHYNRDEALIRACHALWNDVTTRQMYITGAVGSALKGEAFTVDYHLPNDRAYAETCAAVGLVFFARRMMELDAANSIYGDVMERTLYNSVLSSFGLEGRSFFYTNPQEAYHGVCGKPMGEGDPALSHVKVIRQKWYGCACCPPNAARLLASLQQYSVSFDEKRDVLRYQVFLPGEQTQEGAFGSIRFRTDTHYPWDGRIAVTVLACDLKPDVDFALRIPAWAKGIVTDTALPEGAVRVVEEGFFRVRCAFKPGDVILLTLPMTVRITRTHPAVRADAGMVALERGPLVYCLEQRDNPTQLYRLMLSKADMDTIQARKDDTFGGTVMLTGQAHAFQTPGDAGLYHGQAAVVGKTQFTAIPYFQWSNRGETDMQIWIREQF